MQFSDDDLLPSNSGGAAVSPEFRVVRFIFYLPSRRATELSSDIRELSQALESQRVRRLTASLFAELTIHDTRGERP
jgi:hypothetical protein